MSLQGLALITGGAKRIGAAIAMRLSQEGYALIVHYRRSFDAAENLVARIEKSGGQAWSLKADLADMEALVPLIEAASRFGRLTLLVNNASEFEADAFGMLDFARWEHHFASNLRAPVFLSQAFAGRTGEGAIVNILDQRVLKPDPRFFSYHLTKSALAAATTTMAQALAPRIRVNGVAPGPTLANARQSDEDFTLQQEALILERGPSPEAIAEAVAYLAGAKSVTGQVIAVDGGQHLGWRTPDTLVRE